MVLKARRSEHISPILKDLHLLPIAERIQYKVVLLAFKALLVYGLAPVYLTDILAVKRQSRVLRSADCLQLVAPRVAVPSSVAVAKLWNGLPVELKACTDLVVLYILYSVLSGIICWISRYRNLVIECIHPYSVHHMKRL